MRADLRTSLDAIFAIRENRHVTGVTGVTPRISGRNRPELQSGTGVTASDFEKAPHVTVDPVTYKKANGHNGHASYALKTAIPQIAAQRAGAGPPAHCASEISERAAIIVEGDGCGDVEAEQRALEAAGLASWQLAADAWRRKVSDALTFAPLPCTPEGRRLLLVSRKFLASPWHDLTVCFGWDELSLFGVSGDPQAAGKQHKGLVVWLARLPTGSKLEKLTADCAQVRKPCGKVEIYNRFDLFMNEDLKPWWLSDLIIGEAAA